MFENLIRKDTEVTSGKMMPYLRGVFSEMGLDKLLTRDAADYFTTDADVIRERQAFFCEENAALTDALLLLDEKLKEYAEYRTPNKTETDQLFRQVVDAAFYVKLTDALYEKVKPLEGKLAQGSAKEFVSYVIAEAESEAYKNFRQGLETVAGNIMNVKSVTIGVNLNSQLRPKEAGLVSINTVPFKSGDLLDRILRLDFVHDEFHCISPLTAVASSLPDELQPVVNEELNAALAHILIDALRKSRAQISRYFYEKMEVYERISRELTFVLAVYRFLARMKEDGIPLCVPTVSENNETHIRSLYNPFLPDARRADKIVPNDVNFDNSGRLYILTGPNSGGKTVYVKAVATAQLLFQLGLPIPAKSAEMKIMEGVFLFFPRNQAENKSSGRLEEECRLLADILKLVNENTLVLMDETFSSTSAKDGAVLAESCLQKLRAKGCMCIFSTHIHELAGQVERMNAVGGGNDRIDLLAAEIRDTLRTYRILRGYTDGTSDAKTIAAKYGLLS
ncbi:MAG: hypothetical protein E7655_02060 [Ruminococcaceae bacterium]|nr:hypothetical protein [Oscillospiraceae bacterium]